jgi:hypothetical protein
MEKPLPEIMGLAVKPESGLTLSGHVDQKE